MVDKEYIYFQSSSGKLDMGEESEEEDKFLKEELHFS